MKINNLYLLVLIFLLSFSTFTFSQEKRIDSLKTELQNHKLQDSVKVNLLNSLADSYYRKDYEKTITYLDKSEKIARATDYKKGVARSVFLRGLTTAIHSKYKSGDKLYKESLVIYEKLGSKKDMSLVHFNLGVFLSRNRDYKSASGHYLKSIKYKEEIGDKNIYRDVYYLARTYQKTGNFNKAILNYKKAIEISKQPNDAKEIEDCLSSIGNVYSHQGNYPLALEFMNKSLESAKKNGHSTNISDALLSIGNVYIRLQNYDKAITYHNNALIETNKSNKRNLGSISHNLGESYRYKKEYGKALDFYKKSIVEFRKFNNQANIAISFNKIGEIYLEQKKSEEANSYFQKAKKINIAVNNPRGLSGSYLGLAKVNFNKKKYDLSLNYALKGKELSEKLELLDIQKEIALLLSKIYENTGKYKSALKNHIQFKKLNDSLFNKENIEKITQLEYEFKYKKAIDSARIRELKLTKTVTATNKDLQKSKQNYLWAIIGFLLVSILLGSIIFYLKFRNIKSKSQNIAIEQKLLRSQMTPHFIFNSLSILQGMILNNEDKKSILYLSKFSKLLRITLENSRDKLVPLHQELEAVNNYLELQNLEASQSFQYTILVDDKIDPSSFEIPPMLIQPFIENAIEHGFKDQKENRKLDIKLIYTNKELICTIKDNGVGIDINKETNSKHKKSLATTITSERLKMLSKDFKTNGSVTIENSQKYNEQGTIVTLVIPYKMNIT